MTASPLFPLAVLLLLAVADIAAFLARRRTAEPAWWLRYAGWIARPLAALAACNFLFRLRPAAFKFNRLTFPLYANFWSDLGQDASGHALRAAVALAAGAAVLLLLRANLHRGGRSAPWLVALWAAVLGAQLSIALTPMGWKGVVLPWTAEGKVYAWAARRVESAGGAAPFLRDYVEIQRRQPVHARSHPPGATLLGYWTQDRENPGSRGNVLRLFLMAGLNLPLVYLLGRRMFAPRTAVTAATLFGLMPAAAAYSTYSQDTLYAIFFGLYVLLSWEIASRERPAGLAVLAGTVLFALSMLTFSWSIVAAAAFLFVVVSRLRRGIPLRRSLSRLAAPPAVMLLLHLLAWAIFHFSYYGSYLEAYAFHERYYPFATAGDWLWAFVGGQVEFLWAMGPFVAGIFVAVLTGRAVRERGSPFFTFFWSVAACYGIAVIFGPNPLKLETARCWYWVLAFPVLAVAHHLEREHPGDFRPALLAAGTSMTASLLFLSLLNFGA